MLSDRELDDIVELRHLLHRYPELSMCEHRTKRTLKEFLERTQGEIHDMGSWFYCVFGAEKKGNKIAFRAEMDALPMDESTDLPYHSEIPGVSHKCGHDGHAACLCALALVLEHNRPERPVYLIFQPGEEIGAGGKACAEFVRTEGIAEVFAFHNLEGYPKRSIVVREGLTQPASEGMILHFTGKQSHASEPENGRNPSRVIAETILYMNRLLEAEHTGMVLGTVVGIHAGTGDFGISAGEGTLRITIRTEEEDELFKIENDIRSFAEQAAGRDGIDLTCEIRDYFPETRNGAAALEKVRKAVDQLGLRLIEEEHLWRASEDFGYYTKAAEGAIFYIGTGEEHPALHTSEYDFDDSIIPTVLKMLYQLSLQDEDIIPPPLPVYLS